MLLRQIFDPYLAQYAYLIGCQRTGEALLIDPLRDIAPYQALAKENDLRITAVGETHIHADFVSGGAEFAADPEVRLYLSAEGGPDWSYTWPGSRPNTHWLNGGDMFEVGKIRVQALHTPGHTPEHLSFLITDVGGGADQPLALCTGDFVFVGDVGRPDLLESAAGESGAMEPAARALHQSLRKVLPPLPEFLQILPGHGAGSSCGKSLGAVPTTTLGYERRFNAPLKLALADDGDFVQEILSGQPEPPLYFATMKRVNRDGIRVTGGVPDAPHLDVAAFRQQTADRATVVLDARMDRADFDRGHVPRSIHAPLRSSYFPASAGSFAAENDALLLVLESADDADLAARQLYRIGLDGLKGWITVDEARDAGLLATQVERIAFSRFDPARAVAEGLVLDVRTSQEFEDAHIEGAVSIPYTRLKERLSELPQGRRVFVHCGTGRRASLAASFLRARGFEAVHVDGVCADCERIAQARGVTH
jgi:hydroxyacylglutathione hydrolase